MDNLGEDHIIGYFKYTTNSMSEWSLYITPTSWHKCSLRQLFDWSKCSLRQLFYWSRYTADAPSAWAFRLDRDAGCTQCPIVHLPPAAGHQRWLYTAALYCPSPSLERQPRDSCSLQLACALVSPTRTGEYEGGRGREGTLLALASYFVFTFEAIPFSFAYTAEKP